MIGFGNPWIIWAMIGLPPLVAVVFLIRFRNKTAVLYAIAIFIMALSGCWIFNQKDEPEKQYVPKSQVK